MKKLFLGILIAVILFLSGVFIFIPNIVRLNAKATITASRAGLHRALLNKDNVAAWWPGKVSDHHFYFNDLEYKINNSNITVLPVGIGNSEIAVPSSLFFVPVVNDVTRLEWVAAMVTSYNPFKRLELYLKAKSIERDMNTIIQKMQGVYAASENIYGFDIKMDLVVDSNLIQTSAVNKGYPSTAFIYTLVNKLQAYAATQAANGTGYPMLNIKPLDSINFEVKVALPVDKLLPGSGDILQKRMLGRGNILVTEVTGGNAIAAKAFEQIKKYAEDYQRLAPAIPFYALVTNRLQQPDSTKWITKVYFPIM
jgi:hypothetical protein